MKLKFGEVEFGEQIGSLLGDTQLHLVQYYYEKLTMKP
jgi:hypothetical protein